MQRLVYYNLSLKLCNSVPCGKFRYSTADITNFKIHFFSDVFVAKVKIKFLQKKE